MSATQIIDLLAAKHHEDVFVPECKTGPTHGTQHLRLDAWAMKKSWATPTTLGYEVKVTRGDFLRDGKWQGYLEYCSEFYFVTPWKMLAPEELPEGVGLIWASQNYGRVYTKRKAARRDVAIPEDLFRYVLMARCKVTRSCCQESDAEFWKGWLAEKEENRRIGYEVGKAIRKHVHRVERENVRLCDRMEEYDDLKVFLSEELGVNPDNLGDWALRTAVHSEVSRLLGRLPKGIDRKVARALNSLEEMKAALAEITGCEAPA